MKKTIATILAVGSLGAGGTFAADRAVDPYVDEGTHYKLEIKSDIPQGERVEISKTEAAMTLKGWNDEYAITIKPQIPTTLLGAIDKDFKVEADRKLLSKKMEYRSGNVTAFIEPRAGTENEFDIDFTLHSKPDTNVFEYKIEGAEEFDFFYQGELTPEEIAEGALRPENVVGSYAVYHKSKANHRVGSTNYATGKAFHIFRPKAIDANGVETWAELAYVDGVLSVTVPQKFLSEAVYPVKVDPTFGYTTIGGTNTNFATDGGKSVSLGTLAESGDVTKLTVYRPDVGVTNGCNQKGIIYDKSGSDPNVLKGTTPESTHTDDDVDAWHDLNFSSSIPLTAADYFLGIHSGDTGPGTCTAKGDSIGGNNKFNTDTYSDGPADPFGTPSSSSFTKSIYATYTASASATGAPPLNLKDSQTYLKDAQLYIKN